jgi:hypothetical protein
MLMATAITLLMMAAVVKLFADMSGSISNRRALIELGGQLRQARQLLARDLAGCTVPPGPQGLTPWRQRPGEAIGYFEIVEGDRSDSRPSRLIDGVIDTTTDPNNPNLELDYASSQVPSGGDPQTLLPQQANNGWNMPPNAITNGGALGDADDVIALTVRALDRPFVAQVDNVGRVESNLAEVIWFAKEWKPGETLQADDPNTPQDETIAAEPGMRVIYRKVLLIAPWLPSGQGYDGKISMHMGPNGPVPNTLADLTRREYRAAHDFNPNAPLYGFPHRLDIPRNWYDDRENVVLDNALALDARVYDPGAPAYLVGAGTAVDPSDVAWPTAFASGTPTPVSFGAYVDLGWDNAGRYDYAAMLTRLPNGTQPPPQPVFQQEHQLGWHPRFPGNFRGVPAVYDTWTWHYENDGLDQNGNGVDTNNDGILDQYVDEGTNGRDDDDMNGVDDAYERETSPPYPAPLRAVKVILRVYERDARQVREASVINSFVP